MCNLRSDSPASASFSTSCGRPCALGCASRRSWTKFASHVTSKTHIERCGEPGAAAVMFKWFLRGSNKTAPKSSLPSPPRPNNNQLPGSHSPIIELALQHHQAGRLAEAETAYRAVLAAEPDNFDALHLSGVVAHQLGQHEAAAERIARALARNPSNAAAQNNLGVVFRAQGKLDEALACFRKALALQPDYADARTNLFDGHFHFGNVLRGNGRLEAAVDHFGKALALKPDSAAANVNLGNVLNEQGKPNEAAVCYEKALAFNPDLPEAHFNLGHVLKERGKLDQAIECYRKALALNADFPEAHFSVGQVLNQEGRMEEAVICYQKALALNPAHTEARWGLAMSQIPAVYGSEAERARCRNAFSLELGELERWFDSSNLANGATAVRVMRPFLLAYQEENNRELLQRYGRLCARIMSEWFRQQNFVYQRERSRNGIIRIGIISQYFFNHSVWNAIVKGWFQQLDRERFSIHAFYLGKGQDQETRFAKSRATHFEQGRRDLRQWVETILGHQLDVILYPEVGLDPMTVGLAGLRLAPVQVATWGHPETTGLPTIDYYLSAEDLEPLNAQDNYTERLVALPHLGCFYSPVPIAFVPPDLRNFDLEPATPVFLCPGVPFKYAPQHDRVLTEIAHRLGRCRFIFFTHHLGNLSQKLRGRLKAAFAHSKLNFEDFVTFVPWQSSAEFYGWLKHADVFLDTIGFSGFNTAIQAAECGIPIVTREGRFMRGRLASGILKRMSLTELVAQSEEDYIELAVRLAKDNDYRRHVRDRIEKSRSILFEDIATIRALEDFLVEVTTGH
jgi:protein O-GlcNAc transferase